MLTIVLPCAGEGRRLGLPFPKELAPLGADRAVMDSVLDMVGKCPLPVRILMMDDGKRELTRQYVQKRLPDVPVALVQQHRYASDMPEAVLRLEPWLGDVNVLILPDMVYEPVGEPLGELRDLAKGAGFAVAAARVPQDELKHLGALSVVQNTVVAYEDKPAHPEAYNAAWGMLAFSGPLGMSGMRVIASATMKQHKARPPVISAPVVMLKDFRDCGTWTRYLKEIHG